ncbi:CLUMA_CG007283, isoform A [Clunio marinus]|uniref:CLUMA_CG007283, isoform A n=1 Tax=Clunio marinus TaxID=568069 RepID=A0A1J1I0N2_9DIPT|nr:CLUMA_CG007283, isoform A [Clunio marinus]
MSLFEALENYEILPKRLEQSEADVAFLLMMEMTESEIDWADRTSWIGVSDIYDLKWKYFIKFFYLFTSENFNVLFSYVQIGFWFLKIQNPNL